MTHTLTQVCQKFPAHSVIPSLSHTPSLALLPTSFFFRTDSVQSLRLSPALQTCHACLSCLRIFVFAALSLRNTLLLDLQVAYFLIFIHSFSNALSLKRPSLTILAQGMPYSMFISLPVFLTECKPHKDKYFALLSAVCLMLRKMTGTYYQLNKICQIK